MLTSLSPRAKQGFYTRLAAPCRCLNRVRGTEVQGREVHGWLTSSGQTEHPGQTCPNTKEKKLDTGKKKGGKCEKAQNAVKNALEEELIAEMYEMIL